MATARTAPHVTERSSGTWGIESPADRPIEDAGKAVRNDAERTVTHALMITVEITRDGKTRYAEVLSITDANETFISVATTVYVEFGTGERAKPGHRPRTVHPIRALGCPSDPAWLVAAPERAVEAIVLRAAGEGWRVGPSCPVPDTDRRAGTLRPGWTSRRFGNVDGCDPDRWWSTPRTRDRCRTRRTPLTNSGR